ncbi:MAG: Fe-S cluster assembly protein SufD [Euryarchaeota archaeon RBG_16_68_13]|nr:MAG: Fe-S cluster assembly protein SufD [Euryarchaeota archaeon RBG_16_68_13]
MAAGGQPTKAYMADFERFEKELVHRAPAWTKEARKAAIERFAQLGFPTATHEEWRYTNVAPIVRTEFLPSFEAKPPVVVSERLEPLSFGVLKCTQLVFVNGRLSPRLSWRRPLPEGMRVLSLSEAIEDDGEALSTHLGHLAGYEDSAFTALNAAFMEDGAFVEIPAGVAMEEPIHILHLSVAENEPVVSYPRNLIVLGPRSQATVIESYASLQDGTYFTNAVTEVSVGPEAVLDHYKLQLESPAAFHVGRMEVVQGDNSRVSTNSLSLGGSLVRNDVSVRFDGEGSELAMDGLFMVTGKQHVDNHTWIDHARPNCTSLELYKGILDGQAKGIFNGKVFVRKGAMKTNARQTNRNLLLSKDAYVDSTPGLVILADDVKCAHGSSIGQLDEDAIFYLRTRGIDEGTARNLLTYAFASEMVNRIRVAPMRVKVNDLVMARLPYGVSERGTR